MVGRLSRIRVSSVTRTLPLRTSVGTLKSTRTSTRFPRTSRSCRLSFAISLIVLLLLLVIVLGSIGSFFLAQNISALGELAKKSYQQRIRAQTRAPPRRAVLDLLSRTSLFLRNVQWDAR